MPVKIRTVDLCMTNCARLKLRRLVMEVRCPRCTAEAGSRMAFQAKNVQIAGFEQTRIWRAMWRMAALATLCLHSLVLKDERSLFIRVARKTNRIARRRRAQLLAYEPTVGVMTI